MKFKVGDFVVYQKWKCSTHPSLRAKAVHPAQHGDTYSYAIEKFWKVVRVCDDTIEIETRRGKRRLLAQDDDALRKPSLIDRLFFKDRFF